MKKFLFVCTGNVCRSLMAEKLFQKLIAEAGLPWLARSCGIAGNSGVKIPEGTRKALATQGVEKFFHQSTPISAEIVKWADVILCMSDEHVNAVRRFPDAGEKVVLLREHLDLYPPNVEDPIGKPDEVYMECVRQIREAVEALIKRYDTSRKHSQIAGS